MLRYNNTRKRHLRVHSRDNPRLLFLTLLVSAAACARAFSFFQKSSQQQQQHCTAHYYYHASPSSSSLLLFHTARTQSATTALFMAPQHNNPEPDEDEWRALLAAFHMYKAAYGDLKVPSRFIVPGMRPWPENAWNMKLGQRVAAIRSTGKFVQNNETRRKILEEMGFVWRLRAAETTAVDVSFDQIYAALVAFQKLSSNNKTITTLNIPPNFVVPDCDPWPESTRGLPLGKKLSTVRSKSFLKNNPVAREKLNSLGLELDGKAAANDARFQNVYDALVTFSKIYGDLLVPQPFVVPEQSDEWPENTWGLRLGARVNAIRSQGTFVSTNPDRRQQLDNLGFVWSPSPSSSSSSSLASSGRMKGRRKKNDAETDDGTEQQEDEDATNDDEIKSKAPESITSAMENLFGPSFAFGDEKFNGSNGEESGTPTWGFEGTKAREAVRAVEEAAKQTQDEYRPPILLSDTLKLATDNAVNLGIIEPIGEDGRRRKGKREKDIPWFNDDFGQDFVFEDVVEALTVYKSIYGNFSGLTDEKFVVASPGDDSFFGTDDDDDDVVASFDVDASARAAAAIAAFEEEGKTKERENLIATEIRRLQRETESPLATETQVAVRQKTSAVEWPEHLAGMGLGNIVQRIRDGSLEVKHLPERKAQLDAIEFDWGDPKLFIDIPFEKAMCAMYAYYLVRGDMFVYEDFVMPDEDPWPQALAGYEIGEAVRRIRELQYSFEAYHTEKVSLLRAIDFLWFPTAALPLDPNEEEMTPEMLLVSANGHPDYSKMIDIPMGLPDKIIADGPFFETEDPKLWWRKWHNWDYVKDYWYAQGRRDNVFVLRGMGYRTLADEHEEKYGPGMFQKIDELMNELDEGIDDMSKEEKNAYVERLNYFREEMTGCRDIDAKKRRQLLEELDTAMLALTTEGKLEIKRDLNDTEEDGEEQYADVEEEELNLDAEYEETDKDEEDEDEYEEELEIDIDEDDEDDEDNFNVEDELGLDQEEGDDIDEEEAFA